MQVVAVIKFSLILSALPSCHFFPQKDEFNDVRRSIFKISTVSQEAKPLSPWENFATNHSTGTGFYIGENRILTNAHVVANAKYITILRDGEPNSIPAHVTHIAHDCDLAIIAVKDRNYFAKVKALKFGELPKLRSPVSAVGYPTGGEQLSITEGIVSRVGFRRYTHTGSNEHLLVQVDSAINPGNSGGPVLQNGKVIGVAFQGHTSAQNTGYIIPTLVVNRFLDDIKDGTYDGHPELGIVFLPDVMENDGAAEYHGIDAKNPGGVKVSHVANFASAFGKIEENDVILKANGQSVGVDGRIQYLGERVDFRVMSDLAQVGDKVEFEVMRQGKTQVIPIKLTKQAPHPYEGRSYAKRPRYYVFAGLVFTELSQNYLRTWGVRWYEDSPPLLRYMLYYSRFEPTMLEIKELVVYRGRLPHKVNTFAESQKHSLVKSINQKPIHSIADLGSALENIQGEYVFIEFWEDVEPIVLPKKEALDADEWINQHYRVKPRKWLAGPEVDGAVHLGGEL